MAEASGTPLTGHFGQLNERFLISPSSTMLVNKYRRVDSDDEDAQQDTGNAPTAKVGATGAAASEKQSAPSSTPAFVTPKTLSVAPVIPEYKIGVRTI